MSQLREIMQRLGRRGASPAGPRVSEASGGALEAEYERHLQGCTVAMLQYEWTWLEQHLEALELSLAQPAMLGTLGGEGKARALLAEARTCRERLRSRLEALGESPGAQHGPVLASEHAWELSHPAIRAHWGFP